MALPIVGGDHDTWGEKLNSHLQQMQGDIGTNAQGVAAAQAAAANAESVANSAASTADNASAQADQAIATANQALAAASDESIAALVDDPNSAVSGALAVGQPGGIAPLDLDGDIADALGRKALVLDRADATVAGYIDDPGSVSHFATARQRLSARGALVISWDDGRGSVYTDLLPLLRSNHPAQRHTFGITTGLVNTAGYMTTANLQELLSDGHEIASHGRNHVNLRDADLATRIDEYDGSKADLENLLQRTPTTFIYPYGNMGMSITTHRELYGRYERVVGTDLFPVVRTTERDGLFVLHRPKSWSSASHAEMLGLVRMAAQQPVVVSIYSHNPGVDMTLSELEELLSLADDLGVPCLTYEQAFPANGPLVNFGAEDGVAPWTFVKSGSSPTFESVEDAPEPGLPGSRSFRLTSSSVDEWGYACQTVPVTEGFSYTLSGMARASVTATAATNYVRLRLQAIDYNGNAIGSSAGSAAAGSTWGQLSTTMQVPEGAYALRCDMIMLGTQGEAYFDHLHLGPTRLTQLG